MQLRRSAKGKRGKADKDAAAATDGRHSQRGATNEVQPGTAGVNLLSPWVFEELRVHQLRGRFVIAFIVTAVVVGLLWTGLRFNLHQAQEEVRGEEAVAAGLSDQLERLAPINTYVQGVTRRVGSVQEAAYDDVAFSEVLAALEAATPYGATVTSLSVDLVSTTGGETDPAAGAAPAGEGADTDATRGLVGSTCPGPDPFGTQTVVGCLTLEGTATSRDVVGDLVIALGQDTRFVEPFVDTTTVGEADDVSFSGSVGLSPEVFSQRYDRLGGKLIEGTRQ
ncbi:hypothetical protein [Nocardioides sambongensis]|uniref:hypothetical protein n=1 Tax=Nocardioides sambongensis TaxID=2589074 RepID=UPI0011261CB3|nr:hypothetical protein [Nocardioides sambongensis]